MKINFDANEIIQKLKAQGIKMYSASPDLIRIVSTVKLIGEYEVSMDLER